MVGVVIAKVDGLRASLHLCHQIAQELLVLAGRQRVVQNFLGLASVLGRLQPGRRAQGVQAQWACGLGPR